LYVLVKLFQIAIGVVAFIVVPIIAAQERYEPMAWLFGDAPTDAECESCILLLSKSATYHHNDMTHPYSLLTWIIMRGIESGLDDLDWLVYHSHWCSI